MEFINILKTSDEFNDLKIINNIEKIISNHILEGPYELYYLTTIKIKNIKNIKNIKLNIFKNTILNNYQINIIYNSKLKNLKYDQISNQIIKDIHTFIKIVNKENKLISNIIYKTPLKLRQLKLKRKHYKNNLY